MKRIMIPELIQKKRDGGTLTTEEIECIVQGAAKGTIPDYQISAFLMATFFKGMTAEETAAFTMAMTNSGERFDLSSVPGPKVDKHSTGGVGDKVTLILAPLAAACGLKVPSMAGRGLGHTGGTIDKLESIPGYKSVMNFEEFKAVLNSAGCAIIGQSEKIAPADRKLYALRDVTATIESIPLITASILSKKIAEGCKGLVMDIKVGNGAFLKQKKSALLLAKSIRSVGQKAGLEVRCTLSNMDQPLGYAIGNAVEVFECVEVLQNKKLNPYGMHSPDLKELTIHLCAQMLEVGKIVKSHSEGRKLAIAKLNDGSAWKKFQEMIKAQGGDLSVLTEPLQLLQAEKTVEIKAGKRGYITNFKTIDFGRLLIKLGGGREKLTDEIDHSVGFIVHKKWGSTVRPEDILVTIFGKKDTDFKEIENQLREIISIGSTKPKTTKLIMEANVK